MVWIQVRSSDGVVTRIGATQRSARAGSVDYEVSSMPEHLPGDVLTYNGATFTVDSTQRIANEKARLEPDVLVAYRAWQDAVTIGLDCVEMCRAKYEALKAQLNDLS